LITHLLERRNRKRRRKKRNKEIDVWRIHKERRIAKGISLREFCKRIE